MSICKVLSKIISVAIETIKANHISTSCVYFVFYYVYEKCTWQRKRYLEWIIKSVCENFTTAAKQFPQKIHVVYIDKKRNYLEEHLIKLEWWTNIDVSCFYPLTKYCHHTLILLCFFFKQIKMTKHSTIRSS